MSVSCVVCAETFSKSCSKRINCYGSFSFTSEVVEHGPLWGFGERLPTAQFLGSLYSVRRVILDAGWEGSRVSSSQKQQLAAGSQGVASTWLQFLPTPNCRGGLPSFTEPSEKWKQCFLCFGNCPYRISSQGKCSWRRGQCWSLV